FLPRFDPVRSTGTPEDARSSIAASLAKAQDAAQRALKLDPNSAEGLEALGDVARQRLNYVSAFDFYDRALAVDANNPDLLNTYSALLAALGHVKQAIPISTRLRAIEPYVPVFKGNGAAILWASGQTDEAIKLHQQPPAGPKAGLAIYYASQARYSEAADALESIRGDSVLLGFRDSAVRLLRTAPTLAPSPDILPKLGFLVFFYLSV